MGKFSLYKLGFMCSHVPSDIESLLIHIIVHLINIPTLLTLEATTLLN